MTDDTRNHPGVGMRLGVPRINEADLHKQTWVIVWDGVALHAKAGVTRGDIDATMKRLDKLLDMIQAQGVVPAMAGGRIVRPGDPDYIKG